MKARTMTGWEVTGESSGHYVTVTDSNGRVVARVPWGDRDSEQAVLIACAPEMRRLLDVFAYDKIRTDAEQAKAKHEARVILSRTFAP